MSAPGERRAPLPSTGTPPSEREWPWAGGAVKEPNALPSRRKLNVLKVLSSVPPRAPGGDGRSRRDDQLAVRLRRASNSTVSKVLASTSDPGAITDQLYLATLSRRPTSAERQIAIDYLLAGTLAERAEDLQFSLINSLEFLFV